MGAVREVTRALLDGRDPDTVLGLIASHARRLVHADLASISVAGDPGELWIRVADGERADELRGMRFPAGESLAGQVIATGTSLLVPDARDRADAYRPVIDRGHFGPVFLVPLVGRAGVCGCLVVANGVGGRTFDARDVETIEAFASQAALVLDTVRSEERLEELLAGERTGRDLHDTVIQRLFATGMTLSAARAASLPEAADANISRVLDDLDATIREIRATVFSAGD